jgi:hypothetical protein
MENRKCSICKLEKPLKAFVRSKNRPRGYRWECLSCWNQRNKERKLKNPSKYYANQRRYYLTAKGYYARLKAHFKYQTSLVREDFIRWFNNQKLECYYCNRKLIRGNAGRKNNLTIDRKDNKKGYEIDNMVFCCLLCNTIKGDTFTELEMKQIANLFIKPKLSKEDIPYGH